jgi:acetylornithine deacetylase/succinyl-diaminopimelate desuccinylase-like protein
MFLIPSLVLAAAAVTATTTDPPQAVSPEPARQLVRSIYAELIGSNTSYTTGQTTPAAEAMAKRLLDAGFPREDVVVAGAAPHKANVVVRYRGTGAAKPLLLLAHLDVVEAKREDWSVDPFTLLEKDGYFYGRGTGDDKAQAAIWVANLIRYKQEGFRPKRDLIVALTADEEGGGPFSGVDWLLKNRRELIDAELCLNEGGWGEIRGGKRLTNLIQVGEKHSATYRLEVKNAGGHSSMPVKENAIYRLADALHRLAAYEFEAQLNDVTRNYLETLAGLESEPTSSQLRKAAAGDPAAIRAVSEASPAWNAVVRTTCVATGLDGGHAVNALPQTAGARVNCRVLPGQTPEEVLAVLQRVVADDKVTVSITDAHGGSPMSPLRDDVLAATRRLTTQMWPGVVTLPYMVMGGTDGRMLRQAGIPTYGVQGIFFDTSDIRFHGRDERLGVREFYEGQEFLYRLVKELAQ